MPRPRKPTELHILQGTFHATKHGRDRPAGPKSDKPIGNPPPCLGPDEAAAWVEFCRDAPAGLLTSADRAALEATVHLIAKGRRPEEGLRGAELGHLRAFL